MNGETLKPYFTIRIPWAPYGFRTKWHPTENTGPFKVLCRGSFHTMVEAIQWAKDNLNGTPYNIRYVDSNGVTREPPEWSDDWVNL